MHKEKRSHLKSKIFMSLFFSYVIIIVVFFSVFAGFIIMRSRATYHENAEAEYTQKAQALKNTMEVQLMSAQNIVSSINSSETIKAMHAQLIGEEKAVDTMLLFKAQTELKAIKSSGGNINIYNIMMNFSGDPRAFTASEVLRLSEVPVGLASLPYLGSVTVAELWGIKDYTDIRINKEFLIYGDRYATTLNGATKGSILVLFDKAVVERTIQAALGDFTGVSLTYKGNEILRLGQKEGQTFSAPSTTYNGLACHVYAEESLFVLPFMSVEFLPLFFSLVLGVLFVVATYFIAKFYYKPFGNIGKIMENDYTGGTNEIGSMIDGIKNIIGERNGYREKMVTIAPYAKQGMLHGILSGGVEPERLQVLIDEEYIDLKLPYFTIAIANATVNFEASAEKVCRELSTEDQQIACYIKDGQNVFIIVNSLFPHGMEDVFYHIYEKLKSDAYELTMGVGSLESDLNRLSDACKEAQAALEQMLVGGRNAVYFHEHTPEGEEARAYYFPKDALKRLVRAFKEGNAEDLKTFLSELYQKNIHGADLTPKDIRLMVDEMHLTIRNALQAVSGASTITIRIEKPSQMETVDEIFAYYSRLFEALLEQLNQIMSSDSSNAQLKEDIITYINAHFTDMELSLVSVADHFGVSTKYVGIVCKDALDTTFLQYVREKQIRYAAELLKTTEESLETIALKCGFSNLLTFRRNFKAVMGMNPSHYRE